MASDIVITPNRGSTSVNAKIDFTGASTASSQIRLEVLPDNSLSFVGTTGSLFSIADSVTGSLMSVNDASGLPILEVFDTDKVVMGQYNQNTLVVNGTKVGIGTASPTDKLTIAGVNSNGITFTGSNATLTSNTNLIGVAGTNIYLRPGSGYTVTVDTGNGLYVTSGESRALLFRDAVDTGYYVDPGSTSNLNGLTVAGTITGSISGNAATASSAAAITGGMPNGTDYYINLRVIRNNNTGGSNDGMYIGYGNSNSAITRLYGGGSTTNHAYVDVNGDIWRSSGGYQYVYNSGTWSGISIGGNAATATTATTWQTARNFTIGSTARSVNGSSDYSWTVADIGAAVGLPAYQAWSFDSVKTPGLYQYDGAIGATKPPDGSANYRTIEVGSSTRYSQIALPWDSDNMYFRRQTNSTWSTWRTVLTDGNYNSYSPTLTGTGASGTWGISITGNAATVSGLTLTSSANGINPDNVTQNQLGYNNSVNLFGQTDGGLYSSAYSSAWIHQIYGDFRTGQIAIRGKNNGTWQAWRAVLDSSNYTSYAPTLSGSGASGTWSINISGNAATSTTATTATNWGSYGAVPAPGTSFGNSNTIGRSDGNGYTYFYYINSNTSNNENGTVSQFIITNGSDNFYRKASLSHVKSQMSLSASDNPQFNSIGLAIAASGTAGSISLNQSGTRSWSITPTGGNLVFASGDGLGSITLSSTSDSSLKIRGGTLYGPNTTWGAYLMVGGDGRQNYIDNTSTASVTTTNGNLHLDAASGFNSYINWYDGNDLLVGTGDSGTTRLRVYGSSNYTEVTGSMRAPVFYDSNDTNYYVDPAGTSRVNTISFVSGASFGPYLQFNNQSNLRLQAGQQSGAIGISGYDFNGNWKFQLYGDSSGYGFLNGNWAGWDLLKSVSGNLYLNNQSTYYIGTNEIYYNRVYGIADIRSPIFYDNNDTGYYCDPNGYSNLKNITNVYYAKNGVYNNLGNPSVDEKALFHGQFNNKFRFWAPQTQEESTNGTTWTTSTRATSQQLLDLMLGEGQGTSFTAIPAPGTGNAGYYRLTWDSTISGSPAYCFLDAVYCYNSTSGNNVTFTVEAQDSGTSNWVTIATGTISNWPGHTYIPHSSLPYVANSTAGYYKKVRLTFAITSAAAYGTGLTLYGIEWWGGYPAGRRNVEYFDSNRNVFWPAKVYGTQFVDQNNTGYYLDPDGSSNLNTLSITGNTNLGNGNGDAVRIDDILYVGASDSGDSHLYFGEDSSSWYGAHWYWDSGYTHYWYSRNGGTDSTLMQYATNDTTKITFGRNIEFNNYGKGIIGTYASTRYQGVFAMGESYKLPDDGNGVGTLYGIAWSHPNTGGIAGNLASHGMLILENGAFKGAWGGGRLVTTEQVRGTSFYDYNNTSYYLDPDGSSNLWRPAWETYERWNSHPRLIDAGGQRPSITSDTGYWTGTTGWGTSYGTWATYWKYGAGFFDCWGTSSDHPQGSQYVHAQGIQSGQHAAASDGSTGYGWQMVGAGDAANRWWLRGKWGGTTRSWYEIALYNSNVGGNLYADAFYDSGDTGYYLNPAGYSNLNQVSTWFKAKDQNTNWTTGFQNTPVSGMTWHGDVSSGGPTGTWWFYQSMRHSNSSNYWGTQIAYGWEDNANEIYQRNITSNSFSGWVRYLNTNNYTSIGVLIASSSPTITGTWLFASNKGSGVYSGNTTTSPLQVWSNDGGTAFMSFHRSGSYAVNMGLDPDNVFRIGGWSASAGRLTLDMSGNLWSASSMRSSIFYDQDDTTYFINPATDARLNGAVRLDGSLGVGTAASGTAGEIRATNNITAYYSDDRLKTKLGIIENPIEKVKALSGFYFEANETAVALGYQKKREVGVSAQEVQAILPEIIAPAPIDEQYMTVRYEKLIPLLIEAIKEQQKQIEELKSLLSNNK